MSKYRISAPRERRASTSIFGALFHSLGARYDTFVISFLSIVGREKSHGCSCSVYIDRTVFFRESLFHDPCVVTVGHVGYRYRIVAQGVYDECPVADTFGCRQFDFYVAVVWSKDFVIHLFAVGFVAKLAKKEEWYVSFLYLPMKYFSQISLFSIFCFCSLFYFLSHRGEGRIVALLP